MKSVYKNIKQFVFTRLSYLIPKKKGLIVFYPTHNKSAFSGNLKSFFIYLNTYPQQAKYTPVWCSNSAATGKLIRLQGFRASNNKLDNYRLLLRAEHIIQDSTHILLVGKFSIIQLWHGNGFKNSALLDETNTPELRRQLKKAYQQYRIIAASSPAHQKLMIRSFGNDRVKILGSPKNDIFYGDPAIAVQMKKDYGLTGFRTVYAYTPTFRDTGAFDPFPDAFWQELNPWLVANNAVFVVKKHPWDRTLKIPGNYPNIKDMTDIFGDPQELLQISDVLISDYSAIVTDFAITGKPAIYYFHDYESYTGIRSFYYNLKEVLPGPFVYDSDTLLRYIQDLSWFSEPDYQIQFQKFLDTFHTYTDGNSSQRVLEEMEKLQDD